jgi:transcriptional regulator with XRE-family HTH domain
MTVTDISAVVGRGEHPSPFGVLLRQLRLRAGLLQYELARLARIDAAYLNRLERSAGGPGATPSRHVVSGLWDALSDDRDDLDALLAEADLCPNAIHELGGWRGYLAARDDETAALIREADVARASAERLARLVVELRNLTGGSDLVRIDVAALLLSLGHA